MPVNYVMLSVISGIIGIVLAGFTGWHILLASRGQTTIECLEKTRYLSPLRKSMRHQHISHHETAGDASYGQPLTEVSGNVPPQMARPEPGRLPNEPTRQQYDAYERQRARERYEEYLDEQDADKLPSAFDLGWRNNLLHLFGRNKALWAIPIVTTTGDGWNWEPSPKWLEARERIAREREAQRAREHAAGWGEAPEPPLPTNRKQPGAGRHYVTSYPTRPQSKADRILGRTPEDYSDNGEPRPDDVSMQTLQPRARRKPSQFDDISSDEEEVEERVLDHKAAAGWPQKVGVVTNTLLGNTLARQKDDSSKDWEMDDGGVD